MPKSSKWLAVWGTPIGVIIAVGAVAVGPPAILAAQEGCEVRPHCEFCSCNMRTGICECRNCTFRCEVA